MWCSNVCRSSVEVTRGHQRSQGDPSTVDCLVFMKVVSIHVIFVCDNQCLLELEMASGDISMAFHPLCWMYEMILY